MTHTFKLARRMSRFRAVSLASLLAIAGACGDDNPLDPTTDVGALEPEFGTADTATISNAGGGVPFGDFGLPSSQYSKANFTGGLKHLSPHSALSELAAAKRNGVRLVISMAGGRSSFKNSDGTFNVAKWKANVAKWKSLNIAPYIADGTIVGHYLIDEPGWARSWGGKKISPSTLQEMARYSKSIWPNLATTVRTSASYLVGHSWPDLDFAWAQYEGPLHGDTGTPEQWRDEQIGYARQIGTKLMFGMNYLDGGDGSSKIPGTFDLKKVKTRWQMSAKEIERVGVVLASASYGCGLINWRWSPDYPHHRYLTSSQLSAIRAFHNRTDVKAAMTKVAAAARNRATSSCKR